MKGFIYLLVLCFSLFSCSEESPSVKDELYTEANTEYQKETTHVHQLSGSELSELSQITIRLEENDVITCNCDINQLEAKYTGLHDQIGPTAVVHFYADRTSSYGTFARIQGIFEEYAVRTRNKAAKRSFGKAYAMLTKEQKKQVNDAHPINLVEHKSE